MKAFDLLLIVCVGLLSIGTYSAINRDLLMDDRVTVVEKKLDVVELSLGDLDARVQSIEKNSTEMLELVRRIDYMLSK